MNWNHALLTIALLSLCIAPTAHAVTLTPRVYLPLVTTRAETVPPTQWTMDLTIENNIDGELCYEVLGTGPITCMQPGRRYHGNLLHGQYRFWGRGCEDIGYVLGLAPFYYRSATLSFACFEYYERSTIWAKLYEMR